MKTSDKILDGQLVSRCKKGDKKAFTLLVKRWHLKFCKQAFWYTKNKDLAKDIAQDSWTTIFKKLNTLQDPNSFGSWSLSIINRKAIDALRKEKRIEEKLHNYYESEQLNYDAQKDDKNIDNNDYSDTNSNSKIFITTIKQLPNNQQVVLRLFYVEEYSIIEISNMLKVSKGTIKSRLFYAREKLKTILKNRNYEKS